jgi:hypothetical protein
MNFQKYTQKSMEALQNAQALAQGRRQRAAAAAACLLALFRQEDGLYPGADPPLRSISEALASKLGQKHRPASQGQR